MNNSYSKKAPLFRRLAGLIVFAGVLAMIMGSVYIADLPWLHSHAIGATLPWGWLVLINGMLVLWFAWKGHRGQGSGKVSVCISLGLMFLLQLPPIMLWFLFNGQLISDSPVGPVGNWLWTLPHFVLAGASVCAIFQLFSTATAR